MLPPYPSSAQLAQELRRAAATAPERSPAATAASSSSSRVKPRFAAQDAHASSSSESDDTLDSDSDDDDDASSLIEEHFLPPMSEEATWCKAFTYARVLSAVGQHFATDFPMRVLAVATGFSESLNGDIHTVRALDGHKELAISHSRLTPEQTRDVAAFLARRATDALSSLTLADDDTDESAAPSAHPHAPARSSSSSRRLSARPRPGATTPPSSFPGRAPFPPGATPSERAELEALAARTFGDSLLSGLSSLASTPQRARSPSPGPRVEREAREELLEWYQHAGAGPAGAGASGRQSTALDRLLDRAEAARAGGGAVGDEDDLARAGWATEPPLSVALEGGAPVLRVPAADGGDEYTFELVHEEVETEEDEQLRAMVARAANDEAEAEAAVREREQQEQQEAARRRRARRELVGR
ncbi:hypothetical protein JCM9279_004759 [Rhodotorula babjevae]